MFKWPLLLLILPSLVQGSPVINTLETVENLRQAKSEEIRQYLNSSADPCNDFYNFACGNWATIYPATKTKYETNVFQNSKEDITQKILTLLTTQDVNDRGVVKNVKNFYASCINTMKVQDKYKDNLKNLINDIGQMPAIQGEARWQEAHFDWWKTIGDIARKYGINIILGYKIMTDLEDNTVNRLFIQHQDFPLKSLSMYLHKANEVYRQNYQHNIEENLKNYLNLNTFLAQQTAKEILDFEISLVKGMERHTIHGKELLSKTTVNKLHLELKPDLNIKALLENSLGYVPSGKIIVKNPGYQTHLIEVMHRTPKKVVANYIFYNLLVHFLLPIHKSQMAMETKCLEKTRQHFSKVLDYMVYSHYKNEEMEQAVHTMFQELKGNFQTALESGKYNWINETTRKYATEKLKFMKLEVNSYQNFDFNKVYGQLTLHSNEYVENLKNIFALKARQTRAKLGETPKTFDDDGPGMSFGPRYILTENTIKIPVVTLQPFYFWSLAYPQSVNFARLGFLIAHELIHGFDDEGRSFDKLGNDRNWWDIKSAQQFADRTTCFRDQYRKYSQEGRSLRKTALQSENIADNGGVRLTYDTFSSWHDKVSTSQLKMETLPGLSYSSEQLFFISFAQLWCYDILPEVRNLKMSTDSHEPGNLRVIGSLSNFEAFSKAFNCPLGSGMNPAMKCEIF